MLALAACGGGSDGPGGAGGGANADDKAFQGALKFAQCMRQHGVDMPDPQRGANGRVTIRSGERGPKKGAGGMNKSFSAGPMDPKFKAANSACSKYLTKGGGKAPSPAEQAKRQDAILAYARCMRSKGINMPDPKFSSDGGVQMQIGGEIRPDSPPFKAADEACHPLMASADGPGAAPAP